LDTFVERPHSDSCFQQSIALDRISQLDTAGRVLELDL
jgi:hypothetical protein